MCNLTREMRMEMPKIEEVILTKVSLQPGEVLMVTLKSENIDPGYLRNLGEGLRTIFPNNKVGVVNISTGDEFILTAVRDEGRVGNVNECCGSCDCNTEEEI